MIVSLLELSSRSNSFVVDALQKVLSRSYTSIKLKRKNKIKNFDNSITSQIRIQYLIDLEIHLLSFFNFNLISSKFCCRLTPVSRQLTTLNLLFANDTSNR